MEKKIKIKQVRSIIGQSKKHKQTMKTLGLRKINDSVEHVLTHPIKGMLKKVYHLITVE